MDWEEAKCRLIDTLENCKHMVGMKKANMVFYLTGVGALITRFNFGERTQKLYDEIMELH